MTANPLQQLQNTKVLYIDWNCYGGQDMKNALLSYGMRLSLYPFSPRTERNNPTFEEKLGQSIRSFSPDYVLSLNYFPIISKVCNTLDIIYISWVYDSPWSPCIPIPLPIPATGSSYLTDRNISSFKITESALSVICRWPPPLADWAQTPLLPTSCKNIGPISPLWVHSIPSPSISYIIISKIFPAIHVDIWMLLCRLKNRFMEPFSSKNY